MRWELQYTQNALRALEKLDTKLAQRILRKLEFYGSQKNPLEFAKKLQPPLDVYRFRIGEYRVLFDAASDKKKVRILFILSVKHRKEVY